jgi:hypothetical protein
LECDILWRLVLLLLLLDRCGVRLLVGLLYDARNAVPKASRERGVDEEEEVNDERNDELVAVIFSSNDRAAGVNESSLDNDVDDLGVARTAALVERSWDDDDDTRWRAKLANVA